MLNLIARTPSFTSSLTSVSLEKRHYGSQDPCRSIVGEDKSGRFGKERHRFISSFRTSIPCFSSTSHSKPHDDRAWSSQEEKAAATTYDRSGRPESINSQEVARPKNFVNRIGIVRRIKIIRQSGE